VLVLVNFFSVSEAVVACLKVWRDTHSNLLDPPSVTKIQFYNNDIGFISCLWYSKIVIKDQNQKKTKAGRNKLTALLN
jgi:hypothetical protein